MSELTFRHVVRSTWSGHWDVFLQQVCWFHWSEAGLDRGAWSSAVCWRHSSAEGLQQDHDHHLQRCISHFTSRRPGLHAGEHLVILLQRCHRLAKCSCCKMCSVLCLCMLAARAVFLSVQLEGCCMLQSTQMLVWSCVVGGRNCSRSCQQLSHRVMRAPQKSTSVLTIYLPTWCCLLHIIGTDWYFLCSMASHQGLMVAAPLLFTMNNRLLWRRHAVCCTLLSQNVVFNVCCSSSGLLHITVTNLGLNPTH